MEGNKIVKVTSTAQFAKLVELMEQRPYLAKGYHKSLKKVNVREEWDAISEDLNCIGPPSRTGEGWMKVWADFKFKLRKKLAHNKAESHATGGGSFKKFVLTAVEEAAVSLLDLHTIVEHKDPFGIKRPRIISPDPEPNLDANTSIDEIEEPCTSPAPKKCRKPKNQGRITLLEEQVKTQKELCLDLKNKLSEIERYTRKIFKNKEEKLRLYKVELKKKDEQRKAILEIRRAELEIKQKKIELEKLKIGLV